MITQAETERRRARHRELTEDAIVEAQIAYGRKLRSDLTDEQKEKALRVGRIGDQFKSAGAVRQR